MGPQAPIPSSQNPKPKLVPSFPSFLFLCHIFYIGDRQQVQPSDTTQSGMWSDTILLSCYCTVLYCSVLYGEHECQYCLFVHLIVGVCLFKLRAVRIQSWTLGKAKGGMVVGVGGVIMLGRSTLGCRSRGRVKRKKIEHTVC